MVKLLTILKEALLKEAEDGGTITPTEAAAKIEGSNSIFTVTFIKNDGSIRVLNGRIGVKKHAKGGTLRYDPRAHDLIPVHDAQIGGPEGYRMLNKNRITALSIGGKVYKVENQPENPEQEIQEIEIGIDPEQFYDKINKNYKPDKDWIIGGMFGKYGWEEYRGGVLEWLKSLDKGTLNKVYKEYLKILKSQVYQNDSLQESPVQHPQIYDSIGEINPQTVKPYLLKTFQKLNTVPGIIGNRYVKTYTHLSQIIDQYFQSEYYQNDLGYRTFEYNHTPVTKLIPLIIYDFKKWVGKENLQEITIGVTIDQVKNLKDKFNDIIDEYIQTTPNITLDMINTKFYDPYNSLNYKYGISGHGDANREFSDLKPNELNNYYRDFNIILKSFNEPVNEITIDTSSKVKELYHELARTHNAHNRLISILEKFKAFKSGIESVDEWISSLHPGNLNKFYKELLELSELKKQPINIEYWSQVINQSRLDPTKRTQLQSILNNIKSSGSLASPKQLLILQKFRSGSLKEIKSHIK